MSIAGGLGTLHSTPGEHDVVIRMNIDQKVPITKRKNRNQENKINQVEKQYCMIDNKFEIVHRC